jgi:hypothetical protein
MAAALRSLNNPATPNSPSSDVITACNSTTPEFTADPAPVQKRITRVALSLRNSAGWVRI